jgi:prevent-host-death family protein
VKTVSALDVRKRFGELLDEAAGGERIVIERAGQPRAALVPLEDLRSLDPEARLARRREALDELVRVARMRPAPGSGDAAALVRRSRDDRAQRLTSGAGRPRRAR